MINSEPSFRHPHASAGAARAPRSPELRGHPLLVNRPGLHVYGPATDARTPCLHLLTLPAHAHAHAHAQAHAYAYAHALAIVKRPVELAMSPFEQRVHLNGRDAVVTVAPTSKSGFSYIAGGCGRTDWARSIFAAVYLPHVAGASLSQRRFAVGRVRQGWVIWGYIH